MAQAIASGGAHRGLEMMKPFVFPDEQSRARERAHAFAWRSIFMITASGLLLYLTTGQSQTMKTAWVTDFLSIVPSIALLVAFRSELKPASERFPFGHYRVIAICFLLTAIVLLSMGLFLFAEAALKLIHGERPPIGSMVLFGHLVWAGWVMIVALAVSMFVGMYCGKIKEPIAKTLHSKAIEAESATNRNEYMSEGAGIVGIVLVAFGFWRGDAVAAALISLQIIIEGWQNLQQVIRDLMDEAPTILGSAELEDLPQRVKQRIERLAWVEAATVRLREHGHLVTGVVMVVPRRDGPELIPKIADLVAEVHEVDWRLHSIAVMPVASLDG
jgi:cation diffusion facilitator family transporter